MTRSGNDGGRDEGVVEHRVHADSLEYTRTGLRTRESIPLQTGQHHRIVIVRPKVRAAVAGGPGGFPHESSFPLPATLERFWAFARPRAPFVHPAPGTRTPEGTAIQVFGHTSASGDEAYNKRLSDQRARVGTSLLLGDCETMRAVADEEGWGLEHRQAMLRMLGCDPGPVDGELGPRTQAALGDFQERYNRGDLPSSVSRQADGRAVGGPRAVGSAHRPRPPPAPPPPTPSVPEDDRHLDAINDLLDGDDDFFDDVAQ